MDKKIWNRLNSPWIFVFVVTLFSVVVFPGIRFWDGDSVFYIPMVLKLWDPSLYSGDFLMSFMQTIYTIFDEIVVFVMNWTKLWFFDVGIGLMFVMRYIFYISVFWIAKYLFKKDLYAIFVVLWALIVFPVLWSQIAFFSGAFVARDMSMALSMAWIACVFFDKKWFAVLLFGLWLLIHPLTVLPFLWFWYVYLFLFSLVLWSKSSWQWQRLLKIKNWRSLLNMILLLLLPFVFLLVMWKFLMVENSGVLKFWTIMDPFWTSISKIRSPYHYVSLWYKIVGFFGFQIVAVVSMLVVWVLHRWKKFDKRVKLILVLLMWIPVVMTLISWVCVDVFKIHFFVQLQLGRSLGIVLFFAQMLFVATLADVFCGIIEKPVNYQLMDVLVLCVTLFSLILFPHLNFFVILLFLVLYLENRFCWMTCLSQNMKFDLWFLKYFFFVVLLVLPWVGIVIWMFLDFEVLGFKLSMFAVWSLSFVLFLVILLLRKYQKVVTGKIVFLIMMFVVLVVWTVKYLGTWIVEYFALDNELKTLVDWTKENTDKDDVFLVDPFILTGVRFRIYAQRPVFFTVWDGAQVVFDREYAINWWERLRIFTDFSLSGEVIDLENLFIDGSFEDWSRLLLKNSKAIDVVDKVVEEYNVNYLVADYGFEIGYEKVFENSGYVVYFLGNKMCIYTTLK